MLVRRDVDRQTNWSVDYQGEEYTTRAINFISNMKNHGCLIYDEIPQCINYMTLGEKQKKGNESIHYTLAEKSKWRTIIYDNSRNNRN